LSEHGFVEENEERLEVLTYLKSFYNSKQQSCQKQ